MMSIAEYIKKAIENKETITIRYIKYDGTVSVRTISEIQYSNEYGEYYEYISAYCHTRLERRTLKISRIREIEENKSISSTLNTKKPFSGKTAFTID